MTITTGRHRREPGPWDDGDVWLDPHTSPLAVYADRDLPFAPLAVQRDRGAVRPPEPAAESDPWASRPAPARTVAPARAVAPSRTAVPARAVVTAPPPSAAVVPSVEVVPAPRAAAFAVAAWRRNALAVLGLAAALVVVVVVLAVTLGGPSGGAGPLPGPGVVGPGIAGR
ncbi:hypothetical protein [Actinomycetospora sp. TBRC 11914]|uniref:hypothetical protein n=1 Tax=Actinomycetospora sp. TBRC 11914 TaxID=2729387 RepID=UPI00145CE76D|nr:hypothetical protein [Actinomycetospora sp. TBRC 11914]NMO92157.1 hypothetical protein [Actinomycetospora sp. TBRC 11914]